MKKSNVDKVRSDGDLSFHQFADCTPTTKLTDTERLTPNGGQPTVGGGEHLRRDTSAWCTTNSMDRGRNGLHV